MTDGKVLTIPYHSIEQILIKTFTAMLNINGKLVVLLFSIAISTIACYGQGSSEELDKSKLSEFFQNEQYADAIQYLENKKISSSTDINSINALGYAYFMSQSYKEAQQIYSKAISLDSLNFTANRFSALIYNHFKDYKNQLFYYQRLLRIEPSNAAIYKLTGDTYSLLKNNDTALQYYQQAYNRQPLNINIAFAYANQLLDEEMYATADSVAKVFLSKDSLNVPMVRLAIRSFMSQKKMTEAASFTDRWFVINEIDPKTSVSLAQANYNIKNYETCYKVCDTLLKQNIETEALLYYASQAKYKLNEYNKSNELLKQCLNLAVSKNTNLYYFSRADNFEGLKLYKKAIAAYDTAFFLFQDPLALYNIGRLYEQGLKSKTLADQYYRKYLAIAKPGTKDERRVYEYVKAVLAANEKERSVKNK
ncbi:MAG: hypothetical protein H0X70_07635 [Segetibacter sp.]|nr:hypothetical protein [Segetibacter sp.]